MSALTPTASGCRASGLLELSAVQLARLIKRKEISPVELVEQSIERCQEVQALCNPIAVELYRGARSAARRAEADVLRGQPLGRLHGVPFSIKEGLGLAGWPQTCGSLLRRPVQAPPTATAAPRPLTAAGIPRAPAHPAAIPLRPDTR
ncbi:amidase family protein, partial [Pseudomonas protegens]|uniref:amidase family protein n=1 Tax=Pseudomonas protegens TaxID=380021 RepID=UPI0039065528